MRNLFLLAALLWFPGALSAQQNDTVKRRNDCRLAAQIITTGQPAPHARWAASLIRECGAEGGAAVASALDANRSSRDPLVQARLGDVAVVLRDGAMFATALDVLGDAGASTEARVSAARILVLGLQPHLYMKYAEFAAGRCSGTPRAADANQARGGAPMPAGFGESARTAARRVFADSAAPALVRQAARCVSIHDALPFREPAEGPHYLIVAQDLSITYSCGNSFRVRNPYEVEMPVRFEVDGSRERGAIMIPADGERVITAQGNGRVRLLDEDGELIAVAENGGVACSP